MTRNRTHATTFCAMGFAIGLGGVLLIYPVARAVLCLLWMFGLPGGRI